MFSLEEALEAGGVCFTTYGTHGESLQGEDGEDVDVVVDRAFAARKSNVNASGSVDVSGSASAVVNASGLDRTGAVERERESGKETDKKTSKAKQEADEADVADRSNDNLDLWCRLVHKKWVLNVQPLYGVIREGLWEGLGSSDPGPETWLNFFTP
tara:strand:- start:5827 stop:6294 length:468 start_codon:yes stop_codon:yes gene_type:complete